MSNQSTSSVVVAFRALVMLGFLIGIPALVLLNTNAADILKQLAERHLGISFHGSSPASALGEAPRFVPGSNPAVPANTPPDVGSLTPPVVSLPSALAASPTSLGAPPAPAANPPAATPAPMANQAVVPVGYQTPAESLPNPSPSPAASPLPPATGLLPPAAGPLPSAASPSPFAAPTAREPGDSLRGIQQRLRELGAAYVLLESFGNQGLYRFYCKMAVGGNANYTRYFEATDSDPLRAMSAVLQQVEAWRSGR